MRWATCSAWGGRPVRCAEEPDEAELADAGDRGELVEADVALGAVAEVVEGQAQRAVVAEAERRPARGGRPGSGRSARAATRRAARRARVASPAPRARCGVARSLRASCASPSTGSGNATSARTVVSSSLASAERSPTSTTIRRADHGRPVTRRRRARRGIPGDELAGPDQAALAPTARAHRLPGDDSEDVLAARLDRVARGVARHQQDPGLVGGAPHPNLLGRHRPVVGGKNVQDRGAGAAYR